MSTKSTKHPFVANDITSRKLSRMHAKRIGIAIVRHGDQFLVGTRGPDGPLAGYAEFPGGKCDPDEPAEVCAVRECLEETGLAVEPTNLLDELTFDYDHGAVQLHFWLCEVVDPGDTPPAPQNGFRWVQRSELSVLKFPEANAGVVQSLLNS